MPEEHSARVVQAFPISGDDASQCGAQKRAREKRTTALRTVLLGSTEREEAGEEDELELLHRVRSKERASARLGGSGGQSSRKVSQAGESTEGARGWRRREREQEEL